MHPWDIGYIECQMKFQTIWVMHLIIILAFESCFDEQFESINGFNFGNLKFSNWYLLT